MKNIYFLGGSPCCGKSTIAEMISKKYGFQYYKVDNNLEKYIKIGADKGDEWLKYIANMSMDELWLRNPDVLHAEELKTYERLIPYFISDLEYFGKNVPIITEGAAYLPYLAEQLQIDKKHYICIVPTKEFQINQYKKRQWVSEYLMSCSNKEEAFKNWMERDIMFALTVLEQAKNIGYKTIIVDGNKNIDENLLLVEEYFELKRYIEK